MLPPPPAGFTPKSSASDEFQSVANAEQPTSRQALKIIARVGGAFMICPPWLMHDDVALVGGRKPAPFGTQTTRNAAGR
jgi:hypothetical protein